jgi:hypothetical protein
MLTFQETVRLESFGARPGEIRSIERVLDVSAVFCYAQPHANRFSDCIESKAETVKCMKDVLDGLRGWQGDTAKQHKAEVRRWIRRAGKVDA